MKSKLFKIAHNIKSQFDSFAEALKYAWRLIKLRAKMLKGQAEFSFLKKDGSIRKAVGTLNVETKGTGSEQYKTFNFFDVESNGWRSFQITSLLECK